MRPGSSAGSSSASTFFGAQFARITEVLLRQELEVHIPFLKKAIFDEPGI